MLAACAQAQGNGEVSPTDSPTVTLMPAESPAATCAEPAQTKIDLSIYAPDLSSAFTGDVAFPAERFRYKVPRWSLANTCSGATSILRTCPARSSWSSRHWVGPRDQLSNVAYPFPGKGA